MRKIIFESKKPVFNIQVDGRQWILSKSKVDRTDGRTEWTDDTYHPNLCNLLDELAETYFKNYSKKVDDLKDLEKSVIKVYKLIETVKERLGEAPGGLPETFMTNVSSTL